MPIPGKFRYQVGEPFYFYDLRAEIKCDGVYKEVVLVDENVTLKKIRPFLFLIWAMKHIFLNHIKNYCRKDIVIII